MKYDNIHYNSDKASGYQKPFNIVQSARSTGKTTDIFHKVDNAYNKQDCPSIVLRRQINDITDQYILDIAKTINKFKDEDKQIKFYYKKGALKDGVIDIYLSEDDYKNDSNTFLRVIGLTAKMQKLKGGVLKNVKYLIFDEFQIDTRHKEKFLPDEIMRFKEIYTTYLREAYNGKLICWFLGNAYSYYSPYAAWLKLDTSKIKMGCFIVGNNYTYELYKPTEQLIEKLKENPLFDIDDRYEQYALYGVAVNDDRIIINKDMPRNFNLFAVFKVSDNLIGVYAGNELSQEDYRFWCCELKEWKETYRRKAMTFDISDMSANSYIPNRNIISMLWPIKKAINNRDITYKTIGASYILEMIYEMLPNI